MNVFALMIGRAGSIGYPGKNYIKIGGKFCCEYPLIASIKSKYIKKIYVSTDCPKIKKISKNYKCSIIERPKYLASKNALGEDAYLHGYKKIKKANKKIDYLVLLMANSPTINYKLIDQGIENLEKNSKADSAVSTSIYNMWSPLRARKLNSNGYLEPFIKLNNFDNIEEANCDRDSLGDVYFADMGVSVVRPRCFENMDQNLLPQKWMGKKIIPIESEAGCDIDYKWQVPLAEFWIKRKIKK